MNKLIAGFLIFFLSSFSLAQNDEWKLAGQIQLRSELDGRDFSNKSHPLTFASLRTRVAVEKSFLEKINFFVQFQDSRVFGEEGGTLTPTDNIDLHQGYIVLNNLFGWDMNVQAGRFEVVYGTERFFGAVGWHYVGRSWDGVRFMFNPGFKLDLFALTHTETASYIGNATPSAYPVPQESTPSYSVYGLWESADLNKQNRLDLFGYYEINRQQVFNETLLKRFTVGLNHFGYFGHFSTITEAGYQFGKSGGFDISAYLVSLQGQFKSDAHKIGIGADIISGQNDEFNKMKTFSPSFGTNHKFYGYMDYFINIPANTNLLGLNDFYLLYSFAPENTSLEGSIFFHHFMSNKKTEYISYEVINRELQVSNAETSTFGQEIDITLKYNIVNGTSLIWGGSLFFPGDIMKRTFSGSNYTRDDLSFWTYIMITASVN